MSEVKTVHVRAGHDDVHDVFGVEHRILVASEKTGGAATTVEVTIPPGTGSPLHSDERESLLWYGIEGAIDFEAEGERRTLEAGDVIFMERNSRHRFANSGDRPARALMVAVPGGIEGFFRDAASALRTAPLTQPPSPETLGAFTEVARRYGIEIYEASA